MTFREFRHCHTLWVRGRKLAISPIVNVYRLRDCPHLHDDCSVQKPLSQI